MFFVLSFQLLVGFSVGAPSAWGLEVDPINKPESTTTYPPTESKAAVQTTKAPLFFPSKPDGILKSRDVNLCTFLGFTGEGTNQGFSLIAPSVFFDQWRSCLFS